MISKSVVAAAMACLLGAGSLAYAGGWIGDTPWGDLLNQAAIIVSGVAANMVIPGSGHIVIETLEALWGVK